MENKNIANHYQNAKSRAKEFYKTIGRLWCPLLNDYVVFNNIGFQHLVRKGHRPRIMGDQTRRFYLLESIEGIFMDANAKITHEEKIGDGAMPSMTTFWKISAKRNERIITVVVRQIASKQKHFFSVYDQKATR